MRMQTSERLAQYYDFDDAIVGAISDTAEWQNKLGYNELANHYGIAEGPRRAAAIGMRHSVEYLDFTPVTDYDDTHMRLLHTPMGIPVDPSTIMRAMRLFGSDPTVPLRLVGSPALAGNTANRIPLRDLPAVAHGKLEKAVEPSITILIGRANVVSLDTLGYSYGADAAASSATVAARYGFEVTNGVWIESAAMKQRSIVGLLKDFMNSGSELERYVNQTESQPLYEARTAARNDIGYFLGLARLSNVAITKALAIGSFEQRVDNALSSHPELTVTIGWGTQSELTDADDVSIIIQSQRSKFGRHRVDGLELTDMHHAGGDDIDLHAAMMLQGLAK